jgi:hypothetical protein
MGWSKRHDISASDFEVSTLIIHTWITNVSKSRKNIKPEDIPWSAIQRLVSEVVYGGKIDQECDVELLQLLVKEYLNPCMFDVGYELGGIAVPTGIDYPSFENWARKVGSTVEMIQVPPKAEEIVTRTKGNDD